MSAVLPYASPRDSVRIPTVWLAVAVSLALHLLVLWGLPRLDLRELLNPFESDKQGEQAGSLAVRLAPPPPRPVSPPPVAAAPAPAAPPRAPREPPRKEKILTTERPSASSVPVAPPKPAAAPAAPAPAPAPAPAEAAKPAPPMDFAAMVEARRRARTPDNAPRPPDAQPQETEQERHSRQVAENLGLNRAPSFGTNKNAGGGIFQIIRLTPEEASFAFFGWNKLIRRNSMQTMDVKRGEHASIELAVVRRMIAVIRETTTGDFTWESQRLGRDVELSARVADQPQLETFLVAEFFSPGARRR